MNMDIIILASIWIALSALILLVREKRAYKLECRIRSAARKATVIGNQIAINQQKKEYFEKEINHGILSDK